MPISKWMGQKLWYIYTMEYYAAERKKELLPFETAWDGTGKHYAKGKLLEGSNI